MPIWLILLVTTLYVAGLFFMAWRADQRANKDGVHANGPGYVLALAVYCTSWTYFGAVGTAVSSGWDYVWIYVGPSLVFLLFPQFIRRIGDITERENITSLADFLSARYGKSRNLAMLVTLAAVTGSLPYIALQLKSVSMSLAALTSHDIFSPQPGNDTVLLTALAMAAFAIFFGARQADKTQKNPGLMRVLSFEAVVKILALLAVTILSVRLVRGGGLDLPSLAQAHFTGYTMTARAMTTFLLATTAIICLPRQFHVAIIERRSSNEVDWARWLFPLYLALTTLMVVPITIAGMNILPEAAPPDLYVLHLPLYDGNRALALFVFLGGFSAATGMVIVSTIALSSMITNGIIFPFLLERRSQHMSEHYDAKTGLVVIQRIVIIGIVMLAYAYFRLAQDSAALAQIGLLSFAAAGQFAPALVGGLYWRRAHESGALYGLAIGMAFWAYTLFLPALFGIEKIAGFVPGWLNPHALFGYGFDDSLTHGTLWSLGTNIAVFVLVSLLSREKLRDRVQAVVFTAGDPGNIARRLPTMARTSSISPDGLRALASRFLNSAAVTHSFADFEASNNIKTSGNGQSDWRLVQHTEKLLARAIGASSARVIMTSVIGGADVELDDILTLFDQRSQTDRFDQHMLQSMLENIDQGISVVDSRQCLIAWNGPYAELFNYPETLLRVGMSVEELIGYNISRGWIATDNPEGVMEKRVRHMREGYNYIYERAHPDGRYLRISGAPMPGGGYLTTFTDISEDKRRERALLEANETLEERVAQRTAELEQMTHDLEAARREAVGANASKTRFLAAASHDLLQPLNAARLFLGAIQADADTEPLIAKVDQAIISADELLKGLLDISRFDHAQVSTKPVDIPLSPLFEDLAEEAMPMAREAGLSLRYVPTGLSVHADADFLQSILRNLMSNARRYTESGGILLGARRAGPLVRLEIWDTGQGIAEHESQRIFEEFERLADSDNLGVRGAGLGLSIAKRMAELMDTKIEFRSRPGKGSVFWVTLPRAVPSPLVHFHPPASSGKTDTNLSGMTVLCVDDEASILDGMRSLLGRWDCRVLTCSNAKDAARLIKQNPVSVIIADYQLGDGENGIDLLRGLRGKIRAPENICLLTAQRSRVVERKAAKDNIRVLNKPASPADIKYFLLSCLNQASGKDIASR